MEIPRNLGKYQIGQPVGKGGMGFVYRATDQLVGRPVAIKFLRPDILGSDPRKRKRFAIEARTAARLLHPNLVTIYDVGEYLEIPYIVTQFVEGRSLRDLIYSDDLSSQERLDIFCDVAAGLVTCHSSGIVHRDIKPSNVRLSADGRAVLLDFGIAKMSEEPEVTRVGVVVGSAPYMSPEQARGEVVDGRSDLFSLGAMMYQAYAGRKPFDGPSRREVILLRQRLRDDDLPPALTRDGVPEEIDWIIRRLMKPNPEHRYPSARALIGDLEAVRSALSSRGARAGERLNLRTQLSPGRSRTWVTPALASALVLVIGLVVMMFTRGVQPGDSGPVVIEKQPDGNGKTKAPPKNGTEPEDDAWRELLGRLARGETDFGTVRNIAKQPPLRPDRERFLEALERGESAERLMGSDSTRAYERFRKMAVDPTVPAVVARAAQHRALLLLAIRQQRLARLQTAIRLALDGRFAAAQKILTDWLPGAASDERGQVERLRRAIGLLASAEDALHSEDPTTARSHLIELAAVGPPECLDLALGLLDRLDARLAEFGAVCKDRLARATRLAEQGVIDDAQELLDSIPHGTVDAGKRAALVKLIEQRATPAARALQFSRWRVRASTLLGFGDFDAFATHYEGALDRFAEVDGARRIIEALGEQRDVAKKDAQMSFNRFGQHIRSRAFESARAILDDLRRKYPRSRWSRRAEQMWESRNQ